ncbi:hypothetical protein JCM1393_07850 [Clostridium carnis]
MDNDLRDRLGQLYIEYGNCEEVLLLSQFVDELTVKEQMIYYSEYMKKKDMGLKSNYENNKEIN